MKSPVSHFFAPLIPALICGAGLFLGSCGMEDYLYLQPVPEGNIQTTLNSRATIILPYFNTTEYYYFTQFTIFYRIYVSNIILEQIQTSSSVLRTINSTLASDYSGLYYYTNPTSDDTSALTGNIGIQFSNRSYYPLDLQNDDIDDVLSSGSMGEQLTIDFARGKPPALEIGGNVYTLYRSTGNGAFTPEPNRLFYNTLDLYSTANATALKNADVARNDASNSTYTYVSMYITAAGRDNNFTVLYSRPTHIGIFLLPDL